MEREKNSTWIFLHVRELKERVFLFNSLASYFDCLDHISSLCCVDNVGRYALLEPRYVFVQTAALCSTAVFLSRQPPPTAALSARQSGQCLGLDPANTLCCNH